MKTIKKIVEWIKLILEWLEDHRIKQRVEDWIELQCQRLVEFIISMVIISFIFFLVIAFLYFYLGPENIR